MFRHRISSCLLVGFPRLRLQNKDPIGSQPLVPNLAEELLEALISIPESSYMGFVVVIQSMP